MTSAIHRDDDFNYDGEPDRITLQNLLLPLGRQYGVQAIFTGHDHDYERFRPIQGVHTVVTGGGGYNLYYVTELDPFSAQFWRVWHCVRATIRGDSLLLEGMDEYGQIFDTATIQRAPPPRQVWPAAWHSPTVEAVPGNDGDGNLEGQTFDLAGAGIPALAGQLSNLGQLYVNNDGTHLYLGLKSVMIGADQNVFVFLEAPHLPGVVTMAGLGNGQADPQGEGADGLDFLENLAFTNFTPGIACLLGDEWADTQSRSFVRPGLALDIGQGVFRLEAGLGDVAGVRLQQFNQPAQVLDAVLNEGATWEQNADFIEVAIPYEALGGLQPGETIRVGAVVGMGGFSLEAGTRELDTGYLGDAFVDAGSGVKVLEGVQVKLAGRPAPVLRVQITLLGPQRFRLTWPALVGRSYTLESAGQVEGPFQTLEAPGLPVVTASPLQSYDLDWSGQAPSPNFSFFRVKLLP